MIPTREYSRLNLRFEHYIRTTEHKTIRIDAVDSQDNEVYIALPYVHRWTEAYHNRLLHKMYCLEKWYKQNNPVTTLITFTSKQRHRRIKTVWERIKKAFQRTLDVIRKMFKGVSYFWVTEPHKSGYPHIHLCLFTGVTEEQKERIKHSWAKKQKIGNLSHGVNFKEGNSIQSIKNYLLKYMTKSCNYHSISRLNTGQRYFNMIAWDNRIRLIGFSRDISATFKQTKEKLVATRIEVYDNVNDISSCIYRLPSEDPKASERP